MLIPKVLAHCRESGGRSQFCVSHKACLVNTFRSTEISTSLLSPSCTVGAESYFAWGTGVHAAHSRNRIVCTSQLVLATIAFNRAGTAGNTSRGLACELKLCNRQKVYLIHMTILLIQEKLRLTFSASLDLLFFCDARGLLCMQVTPLDCSEHASLPSRS